MRPPLRLAFGALVVFAFATGPALPSPHMLGMDCSADCPECATECCCGPATGIEVESGVHSTPEASAPPARRLPAAPWPAADPGFPGAPPRGPPA